MDGHAALAAAVVQAEAHAEMHVTKWREVGRCRLPVSKPELKARLVSAPETKT